MYTPEEGREKSGFDNQKNDFLSAETLHTHTRPSSTSDSRPRSSSASSIHSCMTQVEIQPDFVPDSRKHESKIISTNVEIELSWKDCIKGLLRPWRGKSRTVTAVVEIIDEHDDNNHAENSVPWDCPWIPTVHVLSKEKDINGRFVDKAAKCMLDTGNLQGNLVSKGFLIEHLGYQTSDFIGLRRSDKEGSSASGHPVIPEAAVKLTWYHPASPRVYRDMRFLVLPNSECELVLCARAIEKHRNMTPPNFMDHEVVITKKAKDKEELALNSKKERLDNELTTQERELAEAKKAKTPDDRKIRRLERSLPQLRKDFEVAKQELENYLKEKEKPTPGDPRGPNIPHVTISDLKGATRAATFNSSVRTSTTRSGDKN